MIDYAKFVNANSEVMWWVEHTLAAQQRRTQVDQTEAEHIIDFLVSDKAPARLRKMSYEQARDGAHKWVKSLQKRGKGLTDGPDDIEVVLELDDSETIVKLLTKKAYEREGTCMAHCLASYDPGSTTIYSYRDKSNNPHATFEVDADDGEIMQIKGKGNGSIHPRYVEPILRFLEFLEMDIRPHDMKNLGYIHVGEDAKQLLSMFVDPSGQGPEYHEIRGESYLYA